MALQIDWVAYVRQTCPDPHDDADGWPTNPAAREWASFVRGELRSQQLSVIADVAMHTHRSLLAYVLPDSTADQLILKLSFMGESAKFSRNNQGFLLVDTSMGQFWFVHSGPGYNPGPSDSLVVDQVL